MNELIAIERIAQWEKLKALVLDSVSSPITKRVYNMALNEFMARFQQAPRPGFTKATVSAWRVSPEVHAASKPSPLTQDSGEVCLCTRTLPTLPAIVAISCRINTPTSTPSRNLTPRRTRTPPKKDRSNPIADPAQFNEFYRKCSRRPLRQHQPLAREHSR
jgi:hypothetical protein